MTEKKAKSKADKENVNPVERLTELVKTNFEIGSVTLILSYSAI